ncbi:unnamed protein product [Rotaria sp. Silwood1]|nr:unnamed protein product [Rotaria sp. Silwood1]CAF0854877.1 unnamed protein product [Rotaria sp. Silwood1]CAF3353805.1 unnamed protein product [Rotaria sp. Silwood1]
MYFFNDFILFVIGYSFLRGLSSVSNDCTSTAVFQFLANGTSEFRVQADAKCHLQFAAFYKHNGILYSHPYTLRQKDNRLVHNAVAIEQYQQVTYNISLFLELKRLRDFDVEDLKRYYEAIDRSVDTNEEIHDFHDIYLILNYEINGQSSTFHCNNGQPIHLPKFISNPWTHENTLTRFRYDAENRDGTFPCEMKLRYGNIGNLDSYKIMLCLTTNTIPARMDNHPIRWTCKLRPRVPRQNRSSKRFVDKETSYCLNHPSGIVIAHVYGPDLKFIPHRLHPLGNLNYVTSYFEPEDFRTALENSDNRDNSTLAVAVIKEIDYPMYMKDRRKNRNILRYLPFNELQDVDSNLENGNKEVTKRLKVHKEQCSKQLILWNENEMGTYSQAHVRLYVAAYDENDILLTEALHPPIRNSKSFEQLRIMRIVQPRNELQAHQSAYVYCDYDYNKSKSEYDFCPYNFELCFAPSSNTLNQNQISQLFDKPHIYIRACYVPNCPNLLQFQVPDDPTYNKHRVYIRLRHARSKDYNPSDIALIDGEPWTYHADPTSVMDIFDNGFNEGNDPPGFDSRDTYQDFELEIQPVKQSSLLQGPPFDSQDSDEGSNHSERYLNTPDVETPTSRIFFFPNIPSQHENTK